MHGVQLPQRLAVGESALQFPNSFVGELTCKEEFDREYLRASVGRDGRLVVLLDWLGRRIGVRPCGSEEFEHLANEVYVFRLQYLVHHVI